MQLEPALLAFQGLTFALRRRASTLDKCKEDTLPYSFSGAPDLEY